MIATLQTCVSTHDALQPTPEYCFQHFYISWCNHCNQTSETQLFKKPDSDCIWLIVTDWNSRVKKWKLSSFSLLFTKALVNSKRSTTSAPIEKSQLLSNWHPCNSKSNLFLRENTHQLLLLLLHAHCKEEKSVGKLKKVS